MGFINLAEKTINAKLVYYGCGMGGKTTSLQVVHEIMCPRNEVQLVSIKTEEDATLLFDFLPIDLGSIEGFKVRIQGFTVPGQPKYKRMRKYVLSGADAVVFVVDSERSRLEENLASYESLRENLQSNGLDAHSMPIVLQYNKRDLEDVLPESELDRHFRFRDGISSFPSVATEGRGVMETFVHAAGQLVAAKVELYGLGRGHVSPQDVAEGARRKLWEIYDASGYGHEAPSGRSTLDLTFDDDGRPVDRDADAGDRDHEPLDLGEMFSDEELEGPLEDFDGHDRGPQAFDATFGDHAGPVDDEEPLPALLDATVSSNLELARRYGELDRHRCLLERKNRELVEVAQNVVHDLNRPLSAIRLMLASMRKGFTGELPEPAQRAVEHGLAATDQMDRLIRDLLDSSRLDFDGVRLEFADVELQQLVGRVLDSMRLELEEAGVEVIVDGLPRVRVDEWAMTRVLTNLLSNAVQYRSEDRPAQIRIVADRQPERFVLRIEDNGIGIPERDRSRLFQRFERGSNTAGISGTGLGLHIVREVLLGHGGDVWFESEEGAGTSFMLALPFEPIQARHDPLAGLDDPRGRPAFPRDDGADAQPREVVPSVAWPSDLGLGGG